MHVRATRRATDACQIGKERVLSAGLSVQIQSDAFATERSLRWWKSSLGGLGDLGVSLESPFILPLTFTSISKIVLSAREATVK